MKMKKTLLLTAFTGAAVLGLAAYRGVAQGNGVPSGAAAATIDLMSQSGVQQVKAEWKYRAAKVIEVPFHTPDNKPNTTYDISPRPEGPSAADFNDMTKWETLDPTSLERPRSTGMVCFNWYRIKVTVPEKVGDVDPTGSTLVFQTTVDDYGEVWVNGQLPRHFGELGGGGPIVAGFNAPNRLVVAKNVQPGQTYDIAIFGINGPISAAPGNWIFLRKPTSLYFYK